RIRTSRTRERDRATTATETTRTRPSSWPRSNPGASAGDAIRRSRAFRRCSSLPQGTIYIAADARRFENQRTTRRIGRGRSRNARRRAGGRQEGGSQKGGASRLVGRNPGRSGALEGRAAANGGRLRQLPQAN